MVAIDASRSFPPRLESAAEARRFVVETLADGGRDDVLDDAALVINELAANAVLHARTDFTVTVRAEDQALLLEVEDFDAALPVIPVGTSHATGEPSPLDTLDEWLAQESMSGRGLLLVEGLVDGWGSRRNDGGKVVWARFGRAADEAAAALELDPMPTVSGLRPARLLAVPVRLAAESEANLEDVERELLMLSPSSGTAGTSGVPTDLAQRVRSLLHAAVDLRNRTRDAAQRASRDGDRLTDIDLALAPGAAATLWQLFGALEQIAAFSRIGKMLALAPRDEVVSFRRWLVAEVERQLRGEVPVASPFPVLGTDDEVLARAMLDAAQQFSDQQHAAADSTVPLHALRELVMELGSATDVRQAVGLAIEAVSNGVGAVNGSVCLLRDDALTVEITAAAGYGDDVRGHWGVFPVNADLPASEAIRIRTSVILRTKAELLARYPAFRDTPVVGSDALAVVPIAVPGALPYGALVAGFSSPRAMHDETEFLEAVAAAAAQAILRLRSGDEAAATAERAVFLERVDQELRACATVDDVATAIAQLAVPRLGDWCSVHVAGDDVPRLVAVVHADPTKRAMAQELHERWPPGATPGSAITTAFATGEGLLFQVVPDDALARTATSEEHLAMLRGLGFGSGMVVPVGAPGSVVAALAIANETGRVVTHAEHALAQEVAALAAAAAERLS